MSLWIGVFLSRLSLDVSCPLWSISSAEPGAAPACMVVHDERVVAVTPAAARAGVRVGMRRQGALALAPDVQSISQDPVAEALAVRSVAEALLQYSPQVALLPQHVVVLEVGAGLRLFGGIRALCHRIQHMLAGLEITCRLGVAPTAHAAWVLARARTPWRRRLRPRSLQPVLDGLSWALLPEAWPHADWLRDIGCRTLGGLARLPREGLQRRTSPALVRRLDEVHGRVPVAFAWIEAPPVFDQTLRLPERIEHAQAAEIAATRLLGWLCDWLAQRQLAVRSLQWQLIHERGRHACPPTSLVIRLAEPASQPAHLVRLLRERLGGLVLSAPVMAVRLSARDLAVQAAASDTLFALPGGTPADHHRLVELLVARLGRDRVLRAQPVADHRPELANHWQAADMPVPPVPVGGRTPPRPAWLLAQPLALAAVDEMPVYGVPLLKVSGPERIEAGWWDGVLCARDYFVAENGNYVRFWVYQERDTPDGRWFLHGLFA